MKNQCRLVKDFSSLRARHERGNLFIISRLLSYTRNGALCL